MENVTKERKILLVEDDLTLQMVHRKFLERLGIHVEPVSTGEDALDRVAVGHTYDAMVLDLGLPGISGEFVLSAIRARESTTQTKRLPIIIVTAHGTQETLAACRAQGADAAFNKPVSMETFQLSLAGIFQKSME